MTIQAVPRDISVGPTSVTVFLVVCALAAVVMIVLSIRGGGRK
jgi:hypothetical protein